MTTLSYEEQRKQENENRLRFIANTEKMATFIGAVPEPKYGCDTPFDFLEHTIERYRNSYDGFDENPDFQRGYVWTREQQIKYCEAVVRGTVGASALVITLNCPDFQRDQVKDSDLKGFVIVDGLQRLTAMRQFYRGEFRIFNDIFDGGADFHFFKGTRFNLKSHSGFRFNIFNFQYKKDILDYYLAFNNGGTVHSKEEIDRVTAMRKALD